MVLLPKVSRMVMIFLRSELTVFLNIWRITSRGVGGGQPPPEKLTVPYPSFGLLHKHVEKFSAPPPVQVGLTAVCFRSRPQPTSTAAAHYPNHCCCFTHESLFIHHRPSTISTPFFLSRSMAIIIVLMAADSFIGERQRRPRNSMARPGFEPQAC